MSKDKSAENALWEWLKGARADLEDPNMLHMERVENSTKPNTPDVNGCYRGYTFHVELKSLASVADLRRKLTIGQAMWAYSRSVAGGASYILIEIAGKRRYLIPGNCALALLEPIQEPQLNDASIMNATDAPIECLMAICGIGQG